MEIEDVYQEARRRFDDFKSGKVCFTEEEIKEYNELKRMQDWWCHMWLFKVQSESQLKWAEERTQKEEEERERKRKATLIGRLFG